MRTLYKMYTTRFTKLTLLEKVIALISFPFLLLLQGYYYFIKIQYVILSEYFRWGKPKMKLFDIFLIGGIMLLVGLAILPTPLRPFAIKGVGVMIIFSIIVGFIILLVGAISPRFRGEVNQKWLK